MDRGGRQPSLLPYLAIVGVYMVGLVVLKLVLQQPVLQQLQLMN